MKNIVTFFSVNETDELHRHSARNAQPFTA